MTPQHYYQMQGMNGGLIINREYRPPQKNDLYAYYYDLGWMYSEIIPVWDFIKSLFFKPENVICAKYNNLAAKL